MAWSAGWIGAVTIMLAGCAPSQDSADGNAAANAEASRFVHNMNDAAPSAPPAKPFKVTDNSALLEFGYAYPAQAAVVPTLVEKFGKEMATTKADALKMAKDDSDAAKQAGFPFRGHSLETTWSVSADTPRFLALRSESYVYTGGAHGMTGYDAVLWDKDRRRETNVKGVINSTAVFGAAIRDRFCAELDKQRAEKRGAPVVRSDDEFTKCIDPMDQVLTLTSKDGKLIDGLTVIVGPYSAGPYSEGSYEIELPIDAAMRKAIRPEYQDGFAAG